MDGTLPGSYYVLIDFAVPSQEGNGEKVQGVARWTTEARASFSDRLLWPSMADIPPGRR
jgi:hypothetical protein